MQLMFILPLLALMATGHAQFYLPIDCDDVYRHDNTSSSGVYRVFPGGPTSPLHVYCDMDTDGGRWTVIQRRMDGTENFLKPWASYKNGFGNVAGEYWLGLDNMFLLTMRKKSELRVDLEDWDGAKVYARYTSFSVDPESFGYQLRIGGYVDGGAGDDLSYHNNMKFTTYDKDQDNWEYNCAQQGLGGFWFNSCYNTNPNGLYAPPGATTGVSAHNSWSSWRGTGALKGIAMKIRPVSTSVSTQEQQE